MISRFSVVVLIFFFISPVNGFSQEFKKILSIEAYDMLNTVPDTYLIDVRTRAEYQFVGHPVGAYLYPFMFFTGKLNKTDNVYTYGFNVKNNAFIEEISKVFLKTNNLLIISRDGTRSALAATALSRAGFKDIYDVADGFEGAEFPYFEAENNQKFYRQLARRNKIHGFNHRRHYGWQWWGLPWNYEMDPKFIYPPDLAPEGKK
jgi:rhodanese-related sulfurtransferase